MSELDYYSEAAHGPHEVFELSNYQLESEQKLIPNSKFRVIDSLWAHFAMFCMTKSDRDQIDSCIRDLLAELVG